MHNIESFMARAVAASGDPVALVVTQTGDKFTARVADAVDTTAPVSLESDWDVFAEADGSTFADALANLDLICARDNAAVA